jgi:hypothetical protein
MRAAHGALARDFQHALVGQSSMPRARSLSTMRTLRLARRSLSQAKLPQPGRALGQEQAEQVHEARGRTDGQARSPR